MSSFIHKSVTEANDEVPKWNVGGVYWSPEGLAYKYVQFKDAITYVAGHVCTWANTTGTAVTNDRADGSSIGAIPAGVAVRVMTQNYYGFILVHGPYATIVTSGADDIAVGESLIAHATTDGACDGVAANAMTTASFGTALAADVDAANTVAGFVRCL